MSDANQNNNNAGEGEVKEDIFGMSENVENPQPAEKKEEDKKSFTDIPDDHPTIKGLKEQIKKLSKDKESMGGNLSNQGNLIKTLQKQLETLQGGNKGGEGQGGAGAGEGNKEGVLFKEIKFSKDLSDDEKDEMTDTELKQFDEIANLKQALNTLNSNLLEKLSVVNKPEEKAVDLNSVIKDTALELSKDETGKENVEMANLIIESAKQFSYEGLTEEQIKERVLNGAKLIPDYKPPKEMNNKRGNSIKNGTGKGDNDPFNIDTIVDEATKGSNGGYSL